jgi:hypothetical protein
VHVPRHLVPEDEGRGELAMPMQNGSAIPAMAMNS